MSDTMLKTEITFTMTTQIQNEGSELESSMPPPTAIWQTNTEWIKKSELLHYVCTWDEIQKFQSNLAELSLIFKDCRDMAHFKEFFLMRTVILIWRGNKLETGSICGTQDNVLTALKLLQENGAVDETELVCRKTWDAEGKEPEGWQFMGEQAARGYFLLQMSANRGERLTVEFIKRVHGILMSGGMTDCGQFRTDAVYADDYVFAPHVDIEKRMHSMVASFEERVVSVEKSYAVRVAVQLMLDFVTIHPFSNGNGRMCRLLFSYALQRMGFPFPVMLDSGHSKSYKHYITALKQAQARGKLGPLLQIAAVSINATLTNYATYSQTSEFQFLLNK